MAYDLKCTSFCNNLFVIPIVNLFMTYSLIQNALLLFSLFFVKQHSLVILMTGVMVGGHTLNTGGGNEYLCAVEKPEWGNFDPVYNSHSTIMGVEFKEVEKIFDKDNAEKFLHHDANCAVCRSARSVQVM